MKLSRLCGNPLCTRDFTFRWKMSDFLPEVYWGEEWGQRLVVGFLPVAPFQKVVFLPGNAFPPGVQRLIVSQLRLNYFGPREN